MEMLVVMVMSTAVVAVLVAAALRREVRVGPVLSS